ncbi:hypothetical protein DDZ13_06550 [Coraliomargarita sinensis]|uniref:Uncharacterized protein n=1 Tax=Coraliomargarita sinensis TaxID=2174842 RepID=A0A317ZH89_9BACT|nr:hypothetical protein [Coraliomargarita sinensis]PXA04820.1 hypothetical protein DDZ13_06550 [Coraliomargarita sinensis]
MNEADKQSPENPAPEPEPKGPAMDQPPAQNSQNDLAQAKQPQMQPDGDAGSGDRSLELVRPESLVDGELPEPSEHVVRDHVPQHREAQPQRESETPRAGNETGQNVRLPEGLEKTERGIRDQSGRYFDPEKHQHSNGLPRASDKGYLRPWGRIHKKAGLHLKAEGFGSYEDEAPEREESFFNKAKSLLFGDSKPKPEPEPAKEPETREPAPEAEPQSQQFSNGGLIGLPQPSQSSQSGSHKAEAEAAAAQLVAMEEMIAVMVFSEEWKFLDEERRGLVMAWSRAFEEKGIVETPWWMELGAAHAVIFASRADKPKTREKLGKLKAKVIKKVIDFRTAKAPAQVDQRKEAQ